MSEALCGGSRCENSFEGFKDFSVNHLTLSRLVKGFSYEIEIQKLLERNSLPFNGNPRSFDDWKHFVGKGVDIVTEINGKRFQIECKYNESTVYPSYVIRDYVTRFSLNNDFKIVVTNDKWKLTYTARQILMQHHIKLFNDYELLWYLIEKCQHFNRNKRILNRLLNCMVKLDKSSTCKCDHMVLTGKGSCETVKNDSKSNGDSENSIGDAKPESKNTQSNLNKYLDLEQKPIQNCSSNDSTTEELKLYCQTCTRYHKCDLYLEYLQFMERHKSLIETLKRGEKSIKMLKKNYQIGLFDDASEKRRELKDRIEEMNREFKALRDKIFKCIARRRYCHINLGYICFRRRMR